MWVNDRPPLPGYMLRQRSEVACVHMTHKSEAFQCWGSIRNAFTGKAAFERDLKCVCGRSFASSRHCLLFARKRFVWVFFNLLYCEITAQNKNVQLIQFHNRPGQYTHWWLHRRSSLGTSSQSPTSGAVSPAPGVGCTTVIPSTLHGFPI